MDYNYELIIFLYKCRQLDIKGCPFTGFRGKGNFPAMLLNYFFGDSKPQSGSAAFGRKIRYKNLIVYFLWNSYSSISKGDNDKLVF